MTYSVPHYLVTAYGTAWSDLEEWQFGFRVDKGSLVLDQTTADLITAPVTTLMADSRIARQSSSKYIGCKVAEIGLDGLYPPESEPFYSGPGSPTTGASAITMPPQATMAVTLETAANRGLAHRGRIFLPTSGWVPSSTGQITTSAALGIANAVRDCFNAINAIPALGPVCVMSKIGDGKSRTVTAVSCGRVVDTQRRRRANLDENRQRVAL